MSLPESAWSTRSHATARPLAMAVWSWFGSSPKIETVAGISAESTQPDDAPGWSYGRGRGPPAATFAGTRNFAQMPRDQNILLSINEDPLAWLAEIERLTGRGRRRVPTLAETEKEQRE